MKYMDWASSPHPMVSALPWTYDDHGAKLVVTSIMTAELIGEAPATPPKTSAPQASTAAARLPREAAATLLALAARGSARPGYTRREKIFERPLS